ncbi:MAG: alanyl-tRNA editing protein [Pseudomonadota bacterium]
MTPKTTPLFIDDAYLSTCECRVTGISERGGIILDQTNFYATSGGQPGDSGKLEREDGSEIKITTTVNGETKQDIILVPEEGEMLPSPGETLVGHVDWSRRYKLMQMHTACHLLSVVCPYPITGAGVNVNDSRVDFEIPEAGISKEEVSESLMQLVDANHPVYTRWITEKELDADASIIRSKNVRPPKGLGDIRLVCIGENASVDSQPCGGTHVTETGEIGEIHIGKIEKKGRENRRFRIRFGLMPAT